jgi:hypothetical protein
MHIRIHNYIYIYLYIYMSAKKNDQTKKVNNRFRPPEINVVSGRVG